MPAFSYSTAATQTAVPPALALPVIEKEFPRQLHPYWPTLQETTRAWLLKMGLMPADKVERYADGLCYTDLMAGYYLGAPVEVLQAIADYSAWFFVWDDRHDRDVVHRRDAAWARLRDCLHAALDAPWRHLQHEDALVAAFADSMIRLYSFLGESWNARFAAHFHEVIEAYDSEYRNRTTGRIPAVTEYLELRRLTFAHWIWLDLLEPAAHHEIPRSVLENPAYRKAGLACQDFAAWYNDLCSLPKELAGDEYHNLGISLIKHEGMTLEDAVTEVRRRVNGCISEFLAAEQEVAVLIGELRDGTWRGEPLADAVALNISNMRNWFSSVYWFHHESGRYQVDSWADRSTPPYISDQGERPGSAGIR
ncbi:epi-isozizaene synthase [Streptomyces uncialis]|uniref:epi-isozizaene synthase n=1 Tax=Streptomyces uncialis TaxID=1048205 RepID=UPI000D1CE336|nr:epi-isozizaene synthase [Streptomyces uncialis]MCX4660198.1 multidrug MFS transporter [Streptomyces uncialis]WST68241.1 multidrug MFS transporter [Streptomyces uncialis]WTE13125.1 multidrug MFS transporter [Streptomyces uncialis]